MTEDQLEQETIGWLTEADCSSSCHAIFQRIKETPHACAILPRVFVLHPHIFETSIKQRLRRKSRAFRISNNNTPQSSTNYFLKLLRSDFYQSCLSSTSLAIIINM